MGQPSSGVSTKLHGEGLDGPASPTLPTRLPTCTRIGAPEARSAKGFTLARSAAPRAPCHGLSVYLVCPCVDGEEGKMK